MTAGTRIRVVEAALVVGVSLLYAALCWSANRGRGALAYDDAVLELGLEAERDPSSPHLDDPLFRGLSRPDLYRWIISETNRRTGDACKSREILLVFAAFAMVACGYVLWRCVFGSRALATLGALLTALPRPSLGAEFWGLLDTEHVAARAFFLPPFLLIVLGFQRALEGRRALLWLGAPCMIAPLHSLSAFYVTGILGLTLLAYHRLRGRVVVHAAGLATVLFAGGIAAFLVLTGRLPVYLTLPPLSPGVGPYAYWEAQKGTFGWAFYPGGILPWGWERILTNLAPMAAAWAVLLALSRRHPQQVDAGQLRFFGMLAMATLALALVPPALYEAVCWSLDRQVAFREFFRPFKFLFLPGVWGILALLRILASPGKRAAGLRCCAGLLLLGCAVLPGLLESRSLMEWSAGRLRIAAADAAGREKDRRESLLALCEWARRETSPSDRFCINSGLFRWKARRPILTSHMESWVHGDRLGREQEFIDRFNQVRLMDNGSPEQVFRLARETGCRYAALIAERGRQVPEGMGRRVYADDFFHIFALERR